MAVTTNVWGDWPSTATTGASKYASYKVKYGMIYYGTDSTATTWGESVIVYKEKLPKVMPNGAQIKLPDGAIVITDVLGNYRIDDSNAKVIYKSNRVREFSPHLNASDMVANFLAQAGKLGLNPKEAMNLPIHLFIAWLIVEAAERDGDEIGNTLRLEQSRELATIKRPRCLACGRFVSRLRLANQFPYCSPAHAERHLAHAA